MTPGHHDILLRFVRSADEGARYYAGLRSEIERDLGSCAREVSDSEPHGTLGCHALLVRSPGASPRDAADHVSGLVRGAAQTSGTCTAVSITAWSPAPRP